MFQDNFVYALEVCSFLRTDSGMLGTKLKLVKLAIMGIKFEWIGVEDSEKE